MQVDALQHRRIRINELDVGEEGSQLPIRVIHFVPQLYEEDSLSSLRTLMGRLAKRERLQCIVHLQISSFNDTDMSGSDGSELVRAVGQASDGFDTWPASDVQQFWAWVKGQDATLKPHDNLADSGAAGLAVPANCCLVY